MKSKLTNIELDNFLKQHEDQSTTEVYEDGQEKAEIIKIAKEKMGIDLTDNSDLAGFKTIYTFSDRANGNKGRVPERLLLQALPTLIGKPVDINHIRSMVVGYYIDFKYIQSAKKMIAYGIFFKSNFAEEWEEVKELLKTNQIGTSHEIWCPKKNRRYLKDGTYEMQKVEFAGGALIYRNSKDPQDPTKNMQTAYEGCDVLEVAMKKIKSNKPEKDLIFASLDQKTSKYSDADLIVANQEFFKRNELEIQSRVDDQNSQANTVPKICCAHCKTEFETSDIGEITCPECKSIVERSGAVTHPPQVFDFSFRDPEDSGCNLLLIKNDNESAIVKNRNNGIVYELIFKVSKEDDCFLDNLAFLYIGTASCPQCNHNVRISSSSSADIFEVKCPSCSLRFHKNLKKIGMKKKIVRYQDITEEFKKRQVKEGDKSQMIEPTEDLIMANLEATAVLDLEIANLSKKEPQRVLDLEVANTTFNDKVVELEIASTTENDTKVDLIDLEVASLNETVVLDLELASSEVEQEIAELEVAHLITEASPIIDLEVASIIEAPNSNEIKIDRYKVAIRTMSKKLRGILNSIDLDTASLKSARELEIAKINKTADQKIEFYKNSAVEINKRRNILGNFANDLSDEKILDSSVYAQVKLEKDNALLKASKISDNENIIGHRCSLIGDDSQLQKLKAKIDNEAFRK